MKSVLYALAFILLCLSATAQLPSNPGSVSGKLKGEVNNEVIDYAMVNLFNGSSTLLKSFMTENDGDFQFDDLPFGTYQVKISIVGYETKVIEDIVLNKDNANISLGTIILKQAINALDEIVVTATKSPIEFNGDTVTYNVSRNLMAEGSTATDILKNVPMVNVDIDGKPSIAGKVNTRVFIDGKPSDYTSATITDLLNVLPSDAIEKVEVISNPDVKYSADGDGIINIVLKRGYKIGLNGALSLTGTSLGNYNANLYSAYRDETLSVSGSYGFREVFNKVNVSSLRTNFTKEGATSSYMNQFSNSESGNTGHNGRAAVDWDITKQQNLRLSANFNTSNAGGSSHLDDHRLNSASLPNELRTQDNDNFNNGVNGLFSVDYSYKMKKNETLTAGLTYFRNAQSQGRDFSRIYLKPDGSKSNEFSQQNENDIANRRLEFNLDYRKPLTRLSSIALGVQSTMNRNSNDQLVHGYDFDNLIDTLKPALTNRFTYEENILAAYGSYSIRTKKRWSFRVGVRSEYTDLKFVEAAVGGINPQPYFNLFPNLAVNKVFKKKYNFGVSYSKRITRPREHALNPLIDDTNQSNVVFGNPELLPSYTDQFQISLGTYGQKWSVTPRISYAITGRIIERFRISPDSVTYSNLATNRTWTYNLFGNYNPTKKVRISGGFSMSRVAYESKSAIQPDRVGLSYRTNGTLTGQFPYNISAEGQLNYYNNTISQGRSQGSVTLALGARKTFMNNKLLVRVLANDPFANRTTSEYINGFTLGGSGYKQERVRKANTTNYSMTLSYRFTKVGRNTVNKQKEDKEEMKTLE